MLTKILKAETRSLLFRAVDWDNCTIAKAEDHELDLPYAIDFEDESVFFETEEKRDEEFSVLEDMRFILRGNITFYYG